MAFIMQERIYSTIILMTGWKKKKKDTIYLTNKFSFQPKKKSKNF